MSCVGYFLRLEGVDHRPKRVAHDVSTADPEKEIERVLGARVLLDQGRWRLGQHALTEMFVWARVNAIDIFLAQEPGSADGVGA